MAVSFELLAARTVLASSMDENLKTSDHAMIAWLLGVYFLSDMKPMRVGIRDMIYGFDVNGHRMKPCGLSNMTIKTTLRSLEEAGVIKVVGIERKKHVYDFQAEYAGLRSDPVVEPVVSEGDRHRRARARATRPSGS